MLFELDGEKKNDADKHKSISKRYVNYVKVTPSQIANQEENETFVDYEIFRDEEVEENTLHNLMGEAFKLEHNSQPLFKQNDLTIFKIYIENSLRYRPVSFNDHLNKK